MNVLGGGVWKGCGCGGCVEGVWRGCGGCVEGVWRGEGDTVLIPDTAVYLVINGA